MKTKLSNYLKFLGKTLFYLVILITLLYLYHYCHLKGGSFIYNEF